LNWDSGRIASSESTQIPYVGPTLHSRQHVYWQVDLGAAPGPGVQNVEAQGEVAVTKTLKWRISYDTV